MRLHAQGRRPPTYHSIRHKIASFYHVLNEAHLERWLAFLDNGVRDVTRDGRAIELKAGKFSGEPAAVFWDRDYIFAYMDDYCDKAVTYALELAAKRNVQPAVALRVCKDHFDTYMVAKTLNRMAYIEHILVNRNNFSDPNREIPKRNVTEDIATWQEVYRDRIERQRPNPLGLPRPDWRALADMVWPEPAVKLPKEKIKAKTPKPTDYPKQPRPAGKVYRPMHMAAILPKVPSLPSVSAPAWWLGGGALVMLAAVALPLLATSGTVWVQLAARVVMKQI